MPEVIGGGFSAKKSYKWEIHAHDHARLQIGKKWVNNKAINACSKDIYVLVYHCETGF